MSSSQITADELVRLRQELADLEGRGRREVAERIKVAREWGDISENSEYDAAKNEQAMLEARIGTLSEKIRSAVLVEGSSGGGQVAFQSTVSFLDVATQVEKSFKIVAAHEANVPNGLLSVASPIAAALIGHGINDEVDVYTPKGTRTLKVLAIA